MKILMWNVRGAGKPSFSTYRKLVDQHHPKMCILLETWLSKRGLVRAHCHFPASRSFYAIESQGLVGGMIVVWRNRNVNTGVMHDCNQ